MPVDQFPCPQCSASLRWTTEAAGTEVRCATCSSVVRVPEVPKREEPVESYDLDLGDDDDDGLLTPDDEPTQPLHNGLCPTCNCKLPASAVICMNCGIDLRTGAALETTQQAPIEANDAPIPPVTKAGKRAAQREAAAAELEAAHHRKEFTLPLILVAIGLAAACLNGFVFTPISAADSGEPVLMSIVWHWVTFAVSLVFSIPILLLALYLVAFFFGTAYGEIKPVLIKLIAIALVCGQISTILFFAGSFAVHPIFGLLLYLLAFLLLFFMLALWLLEAETMEVVALGVIYFLIWIGLNFIVQGALV